MNKVIVVNVVRFIVVFLLQVLVFKRIVVAWGDFTFLRFIIYGIFVLLLPIKTPRMLVVLLAFSLGLGVDIFYDSLGVHAAATTLLGYVRPLLFKILEPFHGYDVEDSPTLKTFGASWFVPYLAMGLFIHLFAYFSIEAFTFVYIFDIVLDTIFSFISSFFLLLLGQFLLNPIR